MRSRSVSCRRIEHWNGTRFQGLSLPPRLPASPASPARFTVNYTVVFTKVDPRLKSLRPFTFFRQILYGVHISANCYKYSTELDLIPIPHSPRPSSPPSPETVLSKTEVRIAIPSRYREKFGSNNRSYRSANPPPVVRVAVGIDGGWGGFRRSRG